MLNNISIQVKLLSALGLIFFISLSSGGFILYSVEKAYRSVEDVEALSVVRDDMLKIEDTSLSIYRYMSSFLNSGDLAQKDYYEQGVRDIRVLFEDIKARTMDESFLAEIQAFEDLFNKWLNTIAKSQIVYMRSPETVDMARYLQASEQNDRIWQELHERFERLSEALNQQTAERSDELSVIMGQTSLSSILGLVLALIAVVASAVFIVFVVSKPLQNLVLSTNALVQKKWDTHIGGTDRGDEVGEMAKALLLFRDNGLENEKLMAVQEAENQQRLERARNIENIVDSFRRESSEVTVALENATQEMSTSSVTMGGIAEDTNKLSEEVLRSAESAGGNVNNVSAATEELTASIQEISQQLSSTNQMALDVSGISENTVEKMKVLENSAAEIGGVIEIISDIAEQTNLLALNATIEAARAGDAGKGFAVVASEVKTLASETAKATEQVQMQIDRIQGDTGEAVSFIGKISQSIDGLTEKLTAIAAAMEEQTSATQEISRNVAEASNGTDAVVRNIGDVSEATRKTQATSGSVSGIAEELAQRSDALKSSIDRFIANIQAA